MAASFSYHSVGFRIRGSGASGYSIRSGNLSVRFLSRHLGGKTALLPLLPKEFHTSLQHKLHLIHGSTCYSSTADSTSVNDDSSSESALILIRHGESLWNEKNLFTGCVDVPLTKRGIEEAIEAGKRISYIPVDVIFTSSLIRAQMTAMLAMTQHRHKKVPIIIHNESEQAKTWTQVFSEKTKKQSIPVITTWQLNERMYGELQGLNKQETAERYGKEKVHGWRRSYDIPPPSGESLEMCSQRAVAYFKDHIEPQLKTGKHVMVAAHGNSLRSIIMYLDRLTSQEVINLELSTGIPLLYIYKEGNFIHRGSPVGLTEAGVYAYTKDAEIPFQSQLASHSALPSHLLWVASSCLLWFSCLLWSKYLTTTMRNEVWMLLHLLKLQVSRQYSSGMLILEMSGIFSGLRCFVCHTRCLHTCSLVKKVLMLLEVAWSLTLLLYLCNFFRWSQKHKRRSENLQQIQ